MASTSGQGLSHEEIEKELDEVLTDSDNSIFGSDSSSDDDLAVTEISALQRSDSEESVNNDAAASVPTVCSANNFNWVGMENYKGQREHFLGSSGPQNDAKNENIAVKIFKLFFADELIELIVRETNTYAQQKIGAKGVLSFRSRMREWKPVTKDELFVILGLFMLMRIVQKPTLRSYFFKNSILSTPIFGKVISMDRFESICNFMHFNNNDNISSYVGPARLFKIFPVLSYLNKKFQEMYLPG